MTYLNCLISRLTNNVKINEQIKWRLQPCISLSFSLCAADWCFIVSYFSFGQIKQDSQHWLDHCLPALDVRFLPVIENWTNFSLLFVFIRPCLIFLFSFRWFLLSSHVLIAFLLILFFLSLCCFLVLKHDWQTGWHTSLFLRQSSFLFFSSFPCLSFPKTQIRIFRFFSSPPLFHSLERKMFSSRPHVLPDCVDKGHLSQCCGVCVIAKQVRVFGWRMNFKECRRQSRQRGGRQVE